MGSYFKNLLLLLLVFFFTTTVFGGIVMPKIPIYLISTLIVLSMGIMLTKPFLDFLTIKINFLTYFLMSGIITVGITFLLKIFMTGFFVESSEFAGLNLDFLHVEGFQVNWIFTIILFAVLSAFISTVFYSLEKID
jgi:uncharacterized membrane protein YvlD (DUF360 family)